MPESELQDACKGSLQAYLMGKVQYVQFSPYANQQSEDLENRNRFANDVVGILNNATLLLLEMKYHDAAQNLLPEFRQPQHDDLLALEGQAVPVAYCYNTTDELEYFGEQIDPNWPAKCLKQFNRSVPSLLPSKNPHVAKHQNLLQWVDDARRRSAGTNVFGAFAKILERTLRPSEVRNGALLLIFSHGLKKFVGLDEQEMQKLASWIIDNPKANDAKIAKAKRDIVAGLSPAAKNKARRLEDIDGNPLSSKGAGLKRTH